MLVFFSVFVFVGAFSAGAGEGDVTAVSGLEDIQVFLGTAFEEIGLPETVIDITVTRSPGGGSSGGGGKATPPVEPVVVEPEEPPLAPVTVIILTPGLTTVSVNG